MKIFVTVETFDGTAIADVFVQISITEPNFIGEAITEIDGKAEFEFESGCYDTVDCIVYCNGMRRGMFRVSDNEHLVVS